MQVGSQNSIVRIIKINCGKKVKNIKAKEFQINKKIKYLKAKGYLNIGWSGYNKEFSGFKFLEIIKFFMILYHLSILINKLI